MAGNTSDRLLRALDCSDLAKEWPKWKQQFYIYMTATKKINEEEPNKIATFLWLIGEHGVEIYNTLFPNNRGASTMFGEKKTENEKGRKLDDVISAFDSYCLPRKNLAVEAFKFNLIVQKENQPFAEFETNLRSQMAFCDYECTGCKLSYSDRMLRDRIIIGIKDNMLQLKLLDAKDEPLENVIEMCKTHEAASSHKQLLRNEDNSNLTKVNQYAENKDIASIQRSNLKKPNCYNCGQIYNGSHRRYCPAKDVICNDCGRRGHFKKYCKNHKNNDKAGETSQPRSEAKEKNVQMITWADSGNLVRNNRRDSYKLYKNSHYRVNSNDTTKEGEYKWTKRYLIQNWPVEFKLDTGADVNCIPVSIITRLNLPLVKEHSVNVMDYNNNNIKIHGLINLTCVDVETKKAYSTDFFVVNDSLQPILGLRTCVEFGLLQRVNSMVSTHFPSEKETFIKSNADLFEGLGSLPGTCTVVLKEGAIPSLHYKKRIPISLHDRLKEELKLMETQGIISAVDYPTDWVNNMQIVEKPNGSLRICLDPKPLNACIKREHFLIPKSEDLLSRMNGKRIFTVLDLKNGFWQLKLDRKSSDLTTFMTPYGRFRWNRMPFGISSAPEMFQQRMVKVFGDIPGVEVYFDDVAVTGTDYEEHDKTLSVVLERARKNNIKFNVTKTQYRTSVIRFMGHILSDGHIRPDQSYIKAIVDMPKPKNKSEILRLLGLLKYLGKFIPNLSKRTASLRQLSRNDVEWSWTEQHEREINALLGSITQQPVLAMFDSNKAIVVQTDSSKDGLGSVLMQNGKAIAYASRTLSKSEKNGPK